MKNSFSILAACIALAGCATVNESYAPDGKKAFTLNCSGTARGWDKCYAAAGEKCGARGYKVIDRSDEDTSSVSGGAGPSGGGFFGVKTNERSMLIECK